MDIIAKVETDNQRKALEKIRECVDKVVGLSVPVELTVDFSLNSVINAGQAGVTHASECIIRLHGKALEHYGQAFIDDTVVHEFAHIIQFHNFRGSQPHGPDFKYVMAMLGLPEAPRCHHYDLSAVTGKKRVRQRRWAYVCNCGEHSIATVTHNRMQNKGQKRICKKCKGQLTWTGKEIK